MADRMIAAIHVGVYRPADAPKNWDPEPTLSHIAREIRVHFGAGAYIIKGPAAWEARIAFSPRRWATDLLPGLKRCRNVTTHGARVALGLIAQRGAE